MTSRGVLVGVCGATGAGKSTTVGGLAAALGLRAWHERVDENDFFLRYMADRGSWALRAQVAFVLGAIEDAAAARASPLGGVVERPAVELFGVFAQDLQETSFLDEDEVRLLGRLVAIGEGMCGVPDVIVMLHASPAELFARIRARQRPGEESYKLSDIVRLTERYEAWSLSWDRCPRIDVDTSEIDLRTLASLRRLASEVRKHLEDAI
ncbi:MAG TPA: deoxynucleoside kinase [Solirubrobacteraceae bacterium]|nr:deoxynucleoside kinase [Solirubrobacteraceae bacterium]